MPDLSGIEALKLIKHNHPEAVVVMVSSVSEKEKVLDCVRSGATNFLLKPFDAEKAKKVLSRSVERGAR